MKRALAGLVLVVVLAPACGGSRMQAAQAIPDARWRANARQIVQQLRVDIATAAVGGTTRPSARAALADVSDLYALLVAYSDLGGCGGMVAASGAPSRVIKVFAPACTRLEKAAELFARAAQRSEPAALARATQETTRAQPFLVRAALAIRRSR